MKILVVGANGQLGKDVSAELKNRKIETITSDITGDIDYVLDFTNEEKTIELVSNIKPDAIINCAAWTAVDAAEDEENKQKYMP